LTEAEINDGYILACQSMLKEDVVIKLEFSDQVPTHPIEHFTGKITATKMLTHDIMEVMVELDRPIAYTAGQFADVGLEGFGRHRSYSFANAFAANGSKDLCFHVRQVSGGSYTAWLFEKDRVGETFELHGPNGAFWLRPAEAPILCIAGGSGMAPIKAILEDAASQNINRPVTYLFGVRTQKDLYCLEEIQALQNKWPNTFQFVPILSEEPEESDWDGKRGMVTEYITNEIAGFDLKDCHAYLCGPPVMIDAALGELEKAQVNIEHVHYDKFLDSRQLEVTD
jgi:NAD(P)H-flavin reductase